MKPNLKFLITGITGLRNRGVEALLTTVVDGLRRRWPDCTIDVLSYDYEFDSSRAYPVTFHANPYNEPSPNPFRAVAQSLRPRRRRALRQASRLIAGASVVIPSGGDVFSSDYGGLNRHLMPLRVAIKHRVPVFFLGHSIGRFRTAQDSQRWLEVARQSLGVTLRESASFQYVRDELGLREVPVAQTADTAFLLDPSAPPRVAALRREYLLADDRPTVACSVSQGITMFTSQDRDRHVQTWVELIRHITADASRQVLIVPHVQERRGNDDRLLVASILERLNHAPHVHAAIGDHSAAEYKGLIATCDFVIAERMHAAIAGYSSGVPTLSVGYSIKTEGVVADAYGFEDITRQCLMPFPSFVVPGQAAAWFDGAWRLRDEMAGQLAGRRELVTKNAERNFELLADLLGRK